MAVVLLASIVVPMIIVLTSLIMFNKDTDICQLKGVGTKSNISTGNWG